MAAQTEVTQGSAPQSCAARMLQSVFHDPLPQHEGFCAHTGPTHASRHLVVSSAAPISQTEWGQLAVGAQGPQSAAHLLQSSLPLHTPLPQHLPQAGSASASLTHWASQLVVQQ